ncbi:hypothetical protein CVM73_35225 [Bradyrhizobium forestalis]|uniref:Uncharacterized protein n=1 Tax=Bradyrhizobium forestalis TaxID=1419263 RepID=A0A2M8QYJ9_9BRAD|nr:SDR family NAD(P)-dependent oxidoreductase [Bradyrhizobium forestalis]PJG50645.1 hypothetical protein CVM73_35225 [Bradyrhizobium forestalis]
MLDGPFYTLKAAWESLTKQPGGRVAVTASVSGAVGKVAYTSAKHGVMGLVRVAAKEGVQHGLAANAVPPGWMDTGLMRGQLDEVAAKKEISTEEVIAQFAHTSRGIALST